MALQSRTTKAGASSSQALAIPKPLPRVREAVKALARRVGLRGREHAPARPVTPQRRRSRREKAIELLAKTAAKVRDFFRCQYPGCTVCGRENVEAAHLENSGMGGRFSVSNLQRCFITLCRAHHQGARSMHTGYIDVRPRSEAGGDGVIDWWVRTRAGNEWSPWRHVGTTRPALLSDVVRS